MAESIYRNCRFLLVTVVELSIIVGALLAGSAAIVHFYDRFHSRGLYRVALSRSETLAERIEGAIHTEMPKIGDRVAQAVSEAFPEPMEAGIRAAVHGGLSDFAAEQAKAAEEAMKAGETSAIKSMARGVGVEKQQRRAVDSAMAEAILGPAKPLLAQFAPGLLKALEDNPSLLPIIIDHPLFQRYIAPRIAQLLGGGGESSSPNPFLKE